jgi:hypothetical protein
MALEIVIWSLIAGAAGLGYLIGMVMRIPFLFVLGCALLIGAGALLWGFDGLQTGTQANYDGVNDTITYTPVVVDMTNTGLSMLALGLIATGVLSAFIMEFGISKSSSKSVFHY